MAVRSLNKAFIIGNLTRDPEMRYTPKGTPVVTFGVATNRKYTPSGATEVVEEAEFHNIVAWGKLGELCSQLLRKGQKVFIEGRLSTRSWEDAASGKRMYRTEIVASDMIVLSPPKSIPSEAVAAEESVSTPETETVSTSEETGSEEVAPEEIAESGKTPF